MNVTDSQTGLLHRPGDEWDLCQSAESLKQLMHDCVIVITDPGASPAIIIRAALASQMQAQEQD